ncbi:MAG: fused MFS/spermidine synthase [Candidatus Riflebacteria bacterium]|nr:fused MFS/spermidine synthase [Candidatus Riflebacteria bacterium]
MSFGISIVFFFSGLSGLILEIVWFRWLHLLLGVSNYSVTAVLTAFMLGLAFGGRYLGRIADRTKNPLKFYAWLEIGIGFYSLFLPDILAKMAVVQSFIYPSLSDFRFLLVSVRFFLAFFPLLPATFLMGGTLPFLAKFLESTFDTSKKQISILYSVNTFGAASGALVGGFFLIEHYGVLFSSNLACTIDILLGIIVLGFSNSAQNFTANTNSGEFDPQKQLNSISYIATSPSETKSARKFLLWATAICGFSSMGLEVCWNQVIPLILGSSIYSFSLILIAFLLGLCYGAFSSASFKKIHETGITRIGFLLVFAGLATTISIPILGVLPKIFLLARKSLEISFYSFHLIQLLILFFIFLVPAACFGAAFPLIARILSTNSKIGESIGSTFWWNTLGTVFGTILTGFVFIPTIGTKNSIFLLIIVLSAFGIILLAKSDLKKAKLLSILGLTIGIISFVAVFFPWDKKILLSGVFRYWENQSLGSIGDPQNNEILYFKEGICGTVSVHKVSQNISLRINGKPDASTGGDMTTQLFCGYLPTVFSKNRKRILLIGLGSGVSVAACLKFPEVEQIDVLELNPYVVEASKLFAEYNDRYWENPKVRIIEEDARNYVDLCKEKYDVIAAEPSNPWVAGEANLFSVEIFQKYKQLLNPGGFIYQFAHIYEMSPEMMHIILYSFMKAFPKSTLWMTSFEDIGLIGSKDASTPDLKKLEELFKNDAIKKSFKPFKIDRALQLYSLLIFPPEGLESFVEKGVVNSDNFPVLEFLAPRVFYNQTNMSFNIAKEVFQNPNHPIFRDFPPERITSEDWEKIGQLFLFLFQHNISKAAFKKALEKDPNSISIMEGLLDSLEFLNLWNEATPVAQSLAQKIGDDNAFKRYARIALKCDQSNPELQVNGKFAKTEECFKLWELRNPKDWNIDYLHGKLLLNIAPDLALEAFEKSSKKLQLFPKKDPFVTGMLEIARVNALENLGKNDEAMKILKDALNSSEIKIPQGTISGNIEP